MVYVLLTTDEPRLPAALGQHDIRHSSSPVPGPVVAVTLRLAGGGLAGPSQTKLLTSGTLSVGRGPGNDWVLPDPDRHLSKTHCVISIENGRTVLTDLSTNGVYINGAR